MTITRDCRHPDLLAGLQRAGKRVRLIREVVRDVAGLAPYERRVTELLKVGKDKRALKLCKKKVGSKLRAALHSNKANLASYENSYAGDQLVIVYAAWNSLARKEEEGGDGCLDSQGQEIGCMCKLQATVLTLQCSASAWACLHTIPFSILEVQ